MFESSLTIPIICKNRAAIA